MFLPTWVVPIHPAPQKNTLAAQDPVRQTIQAAYNRSDYAFDHKDLKGTMAIYAPNFVEMRGGKFAADLYETQNGTAASFLTDQADQTKMQIKALSIKDG